MTNGTSPIPLAGSHLAETRHVCAFFSSDDEEYRVLLPFIRDGIERGEKAVHVLMSGERDDHLRRLAAAGVDAGAAVERGQLELRDSTDTYLRDGRFDVERMLAVFERFSRDSVAQGYPRSRIVCRMEWASETHALLDRVLEFESRVNALWRQRDDAVICTYRLGSVGADALVGVMRTHPMVIIGGMLQRNPWFISPEQFLPEFREWQARQEIR